MPEFGKTTDATIAEMNIRDFSINPNSGIADTGQVSGCSWNPERRRRTCHLRS